MNYNSELQRLKRLLRTDYRSFLDDLDKPWSGMDEDLDLAVRILLKHAAARCSNRRPAPARCVLQLLRGPQSGGDRHAAEVVA